MPLIRKERAGSDSFGNTWPEDGATVEIDDPEQIAALVAIPDGGFSEVTPAGDEDAGPDDPPQTPVTGENPDEKPELSEVDPDAPADEPKADDEAEDVAKPAAKKTAARKTSARKPVEEG